MHTLNKAQRITRSAQRVGHSVRRKLADRYEHGHCTLLFIFQTTEPQVSRHPNDFEIALLVREGDAPTEPCRSSQSKMMDAAAFSCWPINTYCATVDLYSRSFS